MTSIVAAWQYARYLEGWGARYSIFARISSGIFASFLVSVLTITHVLETQQHALGCAQMPLRPEGPEMHALHSGCLTHLVALPISSRVDTLRMIQFRHAATRPSSWNHVSICTRSPLRMQSHARGVKPCAPVSLLV